MFIAENLKRLRLEKGLTQEELAEYMGVTGQAVSKWERDECYPDITLLPGLANLFGVTVDALLGMEEINDRGRIQNIHARANTLQNQREYSRAAAFLEEAVKTYPSDLGLSGAYAMTLALAGDKTGRAVGALERVMEGDTNDKRRGTAAAALCHIYHYAGMTDKAVRLARLRPHAVESRELLLPYFLPQQQRDEYLRKRLPGIFARILKLISPESNAETPEERLRNVILGADMFDESADAAEIIKKISNFLFIFPKL